MIDNLPLAIILVLVGIIVGGAGGATIIRNSFKSLNIPDGNSKESAHLASEIAERTAAACKVELKEYIVSLESHLNVTNNRLSELENTINRIMGACPEKHVAIERRLANLEERNRHN
jgi:membrane protein required for beta-lactamase induction